MAQFTTKIKILKIKTKDIFERVIYVYYIKQNKIADEYIIFTAFSDLTTKLVLINK